MQEHPDPHLASAKIKALPHDVLSQISLHHVPPRDAGHKIKGGEFPLPSSKGAGEAVQSIGATAQAWKQMFNLFNQCVKVSHTQALLKQNKNLPTNAGSQCYSSPNPLSVQSLQLIITMQAP